VKVGQEGAYGLCPVRPDEGISALEYIMTNHLNQIIVQNISDLSQLKITAPLGGHVYDEIQHAQPNLTSSVTSSEKYVELLDEISRSSTEAEMVTLIEAFIGSVLKETLNMGMNEKIDEDQNWAELGVDSLMAIEIRNRLQAQLMGEDRVLTVMGMQENRTLRTLSAHVAHLLASAGLVEIEAGGK